MYHPGPERPGQFSAMPNQKQPIHPPLDNAGFVGEDGFFSGGSYAQNRDTRMPHQGQPTDPSYNFQNWRNPMDIQGPGGYSHHGGPGGKIPGIDFEDYTKDPPLLEELGVNFDHIREKVMAVMLLHKPVEPSVMNDSDIAGPLMFCLILGTCLLLTGKLHFGYIYGLGLLSCLSMYALVNLLAHNSAPTPTVSTAGSPNPDNTAGAAGVAQLDLARTFSVLGYCLLPIVILSFLNVFISFRGFFGSIFGLSAIIWCTLAASRLFEAVLGMQGQKWLLAYPSFLIYAVFALITIF